ncbi:DUF222 domain-containing protein [Herbiconiux sp. P16]|uniref:HNH endonuclease signature motif containing protein n=1 Tax=Herbiconiux wuyangfengii TaxID=3342794 RepID=UPI0035B90895
MTTRTKAAHEKRYVAFQPDCDGMATLHHHLPAVDALAIDDLIDKVARASRAPAGTHTDPDPGTRTGTGTGTGTVMVTGTGAGTGGDADADEDTRTHGQRRSDALTDLVLGRADRPRITPTVLITVPAATIAGVSDAPGDLHGYGLIDPETTRAIAATAPTFLRALLSPESGAPTTITRHRHRPLAGPTPPAIDPRATVHKPAPVSTPPARNAPAPLAAAGPTGLVEAAPATTPHPTSGPTGPAVDIATPHPSVGLSRPIGDTSNPLFAAGPIPPVADAPATTRGADDLIRRDDHGAPRPADDATGRERYTPSPVLRTALTLLDETCRFPGCGRRAARCELDHTTAWAEGGTTTPDNLAHLCTRHHHLKHEGGWKVTAARDGTRTLTWTSPRGSHYSTAPPTMLPDVVRNADP